MSLPGYHVMAKPAGAVCNLDCSYCFYLEKEKLYPAAERPQMSEEVLEAYVRQMIESHQMPEVTFAWQGGEPTLRGLDFYKRAVELQKQYAGGKQISNAMQTNGVLLDDAWCEFLAEARFLIGLSVDGPRHLHDPFRPDKGGQGSYERVMRGLDLLRKHKVEFNTLTVVHAGNMGAALEVYEFLKSIGSWFHQYIPLVERISEQPSPEGLVRLHPDLRSPESSVTRRSVTPDGWGEFLCTIFDQWVRHDVGQVFVQLFEVSLQSWLGLPQGLCLFRETCGAAVALEHNGDLYSCDHYVFPENRLGNLMENPLAAMVASPEQMAFGEAKRDTLPAYCRRCEVRFACHGECPKNRFLKTPDGEDGLNYLCRGYKRFFRHAHPYLTFLGQTVQNRQPASEVMQFARWWDERKAAEGETTKA